MSRLDHRSASSPTCLLFLRKAQGTRVWLSYSCTRQSSPTGHTRPSTFRLLVSALWKRYAHKTVSQKTKTPKQGISMDGDKLGLTSEMPSRGCFFFIVSPSPTDKNRRYVHSIERPTGQTSAPRVRLSTRPHAKPFSSLALCRSYCDFLNRIEGLPDFVVVMESGHLRKP